MSDIGIAAPGSIVAIGGLASGDPITVAIIVGAWVLVALILSGRDIWKAYIEAGKQPKKGSGSK